jgi:hypothetical protein
MKGARLHNNHDRDDSPWLVLVVLASRVSFLLSSSFRFESLIAFVYLFVCLFAVLSTSQKKERKTVLLPTQRWGFRDWGGAGRERDRVDM